MTHTSERSSVCPVPVGNGQTEQHLDAEQGEVADRHLQGVNNLVLEHTTRDDEGYHEREHGKGKPVLVRPGIRNAAQKKASRGQAELRQNGPQDQANEEGTSGATGGHLFESVVQEQNGHSRESTPGGNGNEDTSVAILCN